MGGTNESIPSPISREEEEEECSTHELDKDNLAFIPLKAAEDEVPYKTVNKGYLLINSTSTITGVGFKLGRVAVEINTGVQTAHSRTQWSSGDGESIAITDHPPP